MRNFCEIKKICGFYISNMHLSVMILPYINKEINKNKKILTLLENKLENNINQVLEKVSMNKEEKKEILNINWEETNIYKYSNFEKIIKNSDNNNIDIFVCGSEKYINIANENINKYIKKHKSKIENKKIKIIDCYEVNDFNQNIKEILDTHDMIFNTSGEHEIEEIFDGYIKKTS